MSLVQTARTVDGMSLLSDLGAVRAGLGRALFGLVAGPDGANNRARIHNTPGPRWFDEDRPIRRVHADASMFVGGSAGTAVPIAAPARDGRCRRALRLSRRSLGPVATHQHLPRGHHVRSGRRRAAGGRQGAGNPPPGPRRCARTARLMTRPIPTCWSGCTSPRWTAFCLHTNATGPPRSIRRAATHTSPTPPASPKHSESPIRRVPNSNCGNGSPTIVPSCAEQPRPGTPPGILLLTPPLPLVARAPYGVPRRDLGRDAARVGSRAAVAAVRSAGRGHRHQDGRQRRRRRNPMGDDDRAGRR